MYKIEETPLLGMLRKTGPQKQEIHQYQDARRKSASKSGVRDGTDVSTFNDTESRNILEVNAHMLKEGYGVGDKAQMMTDVAGRPNLLQNEKLNMITMVKRAVDEIIGDDSDQRDEGANGEGSETRGLGSWISASAQGVRPVPTSSRTPAASIYTGAMADLTEPQLIALLKSVYGVRRSAMNMKFVVGEDLKTHISDMVVYTPTQSDFTTVRMFDNAADGTLKRKVNFLDTDMGTIEVHLSPNLGIARNATNDERTTASKRRGYLLHDDGVELKFTDKIATHDLPDLGGGPRGIVRTIFTVKSHPKVLGKVAPTS